MSEIGGLLVQRRMQAEGGRAEYLGTFEVFINSYVVAAKGVRGQCVGNSSSFQPNSGDDFNSIEFGPQTLHKIVRRDLVCIRQIQKRTG